MQHVLPTTGLLIPLPSDHGPATWLAPSDEFLRRFLVRPELAPVAESCSAELALHAALLAMPSKSVRPTEIAAVQDEDVRSSYALFLGFRDRLWAAGTLESYYLSLFPKTGGGHVDIPPVFIEMLVEAIVGNLMSRSLDGSLPDGNAPLASDWTAWDIRAAHMLYRSQRVNADNGQVLLGDLQTLDMLSDTGGVGDMGRFLAEAGAPLPVVNMQVLTPENAGQFLQAVEQVRPTAVRSFLLDLRHEVSNDLSHGLVLTMARAHSGLKALARVLQAWIRHLLGVEVRIRPLQKVDDDAWRWHIGLDAEAMALLNDLYAGVEVEPSRLERLLSLFRLDFAEPLEMHPDVSGKPVYLGLMMNASGVLQLKPQNLLQNLPLKAAV